jgi:hypothetical protein
MPVQRNQQKEIIKNGLTYLNHNTALRSCKPAVQKITKNKQQCRKASTKQQCQSKKTTQQRTAQLRGTKNEFICTDKIYDFESLPCTWKQPLLGSNYCTFSLEKLNRKYFPNAMYGGAKSISYQDGDSYNGNLTDYERDALQKLLEDLEISDIDKKRGRVYPRTNYEARQSANNEIGSRKSLCKTLDTDVCQNWKVGRNSWTRLPCSIKTSMTGNEYCTFSASLLKDKYFPDFFQRTRQKYRY